MTTGEGSAAFRRPSLSARQRCGEAHRGRGQDVFLGGGHDRAGCPRSFGKSARRVSGGTYGLPREHARALAGCTEIPRGSLPGEARSIDNLRPAAMRSAARRSTHRRPVLPTDTVAGRSIERWGITSSGARSRASRQRASTGGGCWQAPMRVTAAMPRARSARRVIALTSQSKGIVEVTFLSPRPCHVAPIPPGHYTSQSSDRAGGISWRALFFRLLR